MYGNGSGLDMQNQYKGQAHTSAPPPNSPLQEVHQRQERVVETLHERIGQLEMRLEGVLVPTGPTTLGHGSATPATPVMSQHHMRGSALADRIEQAIGRIEDVLQRLQV